MTKKFNYNFINKTIEGSKAAIERANKGQNPEYAELSAMLAAHPDFTVTVKQLKKNETKRSYGKLTLSRMEEYIRTQFSDENILKIKLIEFESIQKVAEVKGAKYPLTKKWFLATYSEYKTLGVSESETAALNKAAAAQEDSIETETVEFSPAA